MADCHNLFLKYHEKIELTKTKENYLRQAREALENKIKEYFKNVLKIKIPDFKLQGSFSTNITINPLDNEFDIDDGIYLNNLPYSFEEWPKPENVHDLVFNSVEGHTEEKPIDKRTCVRVIYAKNYHVDFPIYGNYLSNTYLAEKGEKGWNISEPIKLKEWFLNNISNHGEQLRRIIRYLKAWADFESKKGIMPSSLVISILTINAYKNYARDDSCFTNILNIIKDNINKNFIVYNPVDLTEDLTNKITDSQKERFKKRINLFAADAINALQLDLKEEACKIWYRYFGNRFPECDNLDEESSTFKTSAPALLHNDGRSAHE